MHAPIGSPRFAVLKGRWFPRLPRIVTITFLALLLALLVSGSNRFSRQPPRMQTVYLPALQAEVQMLRTKSYQGPALVRACLYGRDHTRCLDDRWLPYDRIDTVAAKIGRPRQLGEHDVLGCVYVQRGNACACERHNFSLTLAEFR